MFAKFETTASKWKENPDLLRKNYLFDPVEGVAGGVYLWRERAHVEKWHGPEFGRMIQQMWESEPQSHLFETPIVVDNLSGTVARD